MSISPDFGPSSNSTSNFEIGKYNTRRRHPTMNRKRLRDLGITIGKYPTGKYNAITDVAGVEVGQATLMYDTPRIARTGVTIIEPRGAQTWDDSCFAGTYSFNG